MSESEANRDQSVVNDQPPASEGKPGHEEARQLRSKTTRFLTQLDALMETTNRIMAIVTRSRIRAQNELSAFLNPRFENSEDGETARFESPSEDFREYQRLSKAFAKAREAARLVPRSFLVSMVIQYDTYLAGTVRLLFKLKPEKIRAADTSIKVGEIVKYETLADLLQALVDEEIDEQLRGSHLDQLRWMEKRFDFKVDDKDLLVQNFIEITERRNAFVHTDGTANRQYLKACKGFASSIDACKELGMSLVSNRSYLEKARNTLFEIGLRVQQIAWRKQRADQRQLQDAALNAVIFDLLNRQDYSLARSIADFATTLRDLADDRNKKMITINQAQAYKWSGKPERAREIIDSLDWSSSATLFRLAVALIRDDFAEALRHMSSVPIEGEDGFDREAYRSWPIFKEARNNEDFLNAFEKKFGEPLVRHTVDICKDQTLDLVTEPESEALVGAEKAEAIN